MTYSYKLTSVRRPLLISSSPQELLDQSFPDLVCSNYRVRKEENVNFMILHQRGGNFEVKINYVSLKILFSTPGHVFDKQIFNINDQGRVNQNCKFHNRQDRGSCAWAWP